MPGLLGDHLPKPHLPAGCRCREVGGWVGASVGGASARPCSPADPRWVRSRHFCSQFAILLLTFLFPFHRPLPLPLGFRLHEGRDPVCRAFLYVPSALLRAWT